MQFVTTRQEKLTIGKNTTNNKCEEIQMNRKKAAAIDLGTNTAHLLIAESMESGFEIVFKKRHYVFLADMGMEIIKQDAQLRLFKALDNFYYEIDHRSVEKIIVTSTEAFRKASNGEEVIDQIQRKYGWTVEIISGDREAELIYKGVKSIVNLNSGNYLIMDIGGGSVEFIITEKDEMVWKASFPIGIAKLHNLDLINDPLNENDILVIKNYLHNALGALDEQLKTFHPITLIGAAGSFEILTQKKSPSDSICPIVKTEVFLHYLNEVIGLNEEDRAKLAWIPKERAKYVIMAILLIQVAIEITGTQEIIVSPYSLKEGLISEYF